MNRDDWGYLTIILVLLTIMMFAGYMSDQGCS